MDYSSEINSVIYGVFIALIGSMVLSFILWILDIIARWKINTKAGRTGWFALIPCLSEFTLFDLATGMGWLGVVYFILSLFGLSISFSQLMQLSSGTYDFTSPGGLSSGLSMLISVVSWVLSIFLAVKLSRAFGKGVGYIILLIFVAPIARMMLGFGSAVYYGVDGEGTDGYGNVGGTTAQGPDPNTGAFGGTVPPAPDNGPFNNMTPPPAPQMRFCTHCGAEYKAGSKFCEQCGGPLES